MLNKLTNSSRLLDCSRLFSIGFVGVLAFMGLANIAPNLFSNSSRRAIINVPVTLVTSPISGRILEGPASGGERFRAGDVVARVENATVDRSVLMELRLQSLAADEKLTNLTTDFEQNRRRAGELSTQIEELKTEVMVQLTESEGEARAKLTSASAIADTRRTQSKRMRPLLDSKIVTKFHIELLDQLAVAAEADRTAAEHALRSRVAALQAAGRGAFIGEAFSLLTGLQQQRIAATAAMTKLQGELKAAKLRGRELKRLINAETSRLESLSEAVIVAPTDGYVLDVKQLQGQFVDAGSEILRTTSCGTALVTAVFPISMVGDLTLGAPVTVELLEEGRRVTGRVSRILPRDSDRESERLWVPLPPAQSNEIYVLMSLDEEFSREGLDQHCNIGGWVRASIDSRWQRSFGSKIRQVYSVLETLIGPADDGVLTAAQNAQHKLILDRNVQAAVVAEEQDVPNFSAGR